MKKAVLRSIGIVGLMVFFPIFVFTFLDPNLIEKTGRTFIEWKLNKEVNKKIDQLSVQDALASSEKANQFLSKKALEKIGALDHSLDRLKQQLKDDAPAMIAAQIAKMRDLDCECRQKWEDALQRSMVARIVDLESARAKLVDFTQAKYMEIVNNLTLDVRIFVGANSTIFLLLLLVSFLKPLAINHLFLPGSLMAVSTLICSFFYIFEQNWVYTILYNDYTGFAYIGYLLCVFAILCDIIFNRARVTTEIINCILNAIGSATSLVPC